MGFLQRRLKWLLPVPLIPVAAAAWWNLRIETSPGIDHDGGVNHAIFDGESDLPVRLFPGRDWVVEYDCGRCHAPDVDREGPGIPPDLSFAGSRYQREWIVDYIQKPYRRRYISDSTWPKVKMANFRLKRERAEAIADYLLFHKDTIMFPPAPEALVTDSVSIARGRKLYRQYQCSGCHAIARDGGRVGPALDGVGLRLTNAYIRALLADPNRIIPETSMKDNDLWDEEIDALTVYLQSLRSDSPR